MQTNETSKATTNAPRRNMNNVADVLAAVMDERFGKVHGSDGESTSDEEEEEDDDWDDDYSDWKVDIVMQ